MILSTLSLLSLFSYIYLHTTPLCLSVHIYSVYTVYMCILTVLLKVLGAPSGVIPSDTRRRGRWTVDEMVVTT